jgi:hypothetical protein
MSKLLEDYLTEVEMAAELGKAVRTLQLWRAQRKGPPWTQNGREVLYHRDSGRAWLRSQEHQPVRERARHSA